MPPLIAIPSAHPSSKQTPKAPLPSFRTAGVQLGTYPTFPKWNAISNRNTPKLKFILTHTKQSLAQFLIATFRALVRRSAVSSHPAHRSSTTPALIAIKSASRKLEISLTHFYSVTSKFLIDNFHRHLSSSLSPGSPAPSRLKGPFTRPTKRKTPRLVLTKAKGPCSSNRHTYEKLELLLSAFRISETSISNRLKTALHPRCKRRLGRQASRQSGGWREPAPYAAAAGKSRGRPARRQRCDSSC
jgi:hypothetical protein